MCCVLLFWDQGVTLFVRGYLISCLLHIIFISDGTTTCQMNSTNVDFVLPDYLTFCGRDLDNNTTVLSCKYFGISNLSFSPIAMRYTSVCVCVYVCRRVCVHACAVNLEKESQSKKTMLTVSLFQRTGIHKTVKKIINICSTPLIHMYYKSHIIHGVCIYI